MRIIMYRDMKVAYTGNVALIECLHNKLVLGKDILYILDECNGDFDYMINYIEDSQNGADFNDNKIIIRGSLNYLKSTTLIQVIIFLLYQKKILLNSIISLHASAIIKDQTVYLFLGSKGSGKTTMSFLLSQKYDEVKLISNDYVELMLNGNHTFSIISSDYKNDIAFRSHVLFQIDNKLYQEIYGDNKLVFNDIVKIKGEFVNLEEQKVLFRKIIIINVALGKTNRIEVIQKEGMELSIELYKEIVQYVRCKNVSVIESNKSISPFYLDDKFFFDNKVNRKVNEIINILVNDPNVDIKWVRGPLTEIEQFIINMDDWRNNTYERLS